MSRLWNLIPAPWRWAAAGLLGLLILAAVLGSYAYVFRLGAAAEDARCQAANDAAALSWLRLELQIAQDGAALARQQANDLTARETTLQQRLNDYESSEASSAAGACVLSDGDAARLRDLVR